MKIIFLDIDGVLVTRDSMMNDVRHGKQTRTEVLSSAFMHSFDKNAVENLNHILDSTNAFIVISSVWRCLWDFDVLKTHFVLQGINADKILDTTPDLRGQPRGTEIARWLLDRGIPIGIDSFVILDDDDDMNPHLNKLVQTKFVDGLTRNLANTAISILTQSGR